MNKLRVFLLLPLLLLMPSVFAESMSSYSHDTMGKQMMSNHYVSPHKQMKQGVEAHMIQCRDGYGLYMKAHGYEPVCIKPSSVNSLITRGWLLQHDMAYSGMNSHMNQTK